MKSFEATWRSLAARFRTALMSTPHVRSWWFDLGALLSVAILNPLVYGMRTPSSLKPDAVSYLTFAESALSKGQLFLSGWGHIDTAVILPPLFPSLVAAVRAFGTEWVEGAVWVNTFASLAVVVPLYLYVRHLTNAWVGAAAVLLVQFDLFYLYYSRVPLTEALFILVVAATLYQAQRVFGGGRSLSGAFLLGLLSAAVYFSRQIGFVVGPFLVLWAFLSAVLGTKDSSPKSWRLPAAIALGWAVLVVPYASILYLQTGQPIWKQSFRQNVYVVESSDPQVLGKIERLSSGGSDYGEVYKNRRELRALTPNGDEMLAYVVPAQAGERSSIAPPDQEEGVVSLGAIGRNVLLNLDHLLKRLGWWLAILAVGAAVTPFLFGGTTLASRLPRLLVPGFAAAYIVGVSLFTGAIDRYVVVLYPFVIAHVAVEIGILARLARDRIGNAHAPRVVGGLLFILTLWLAPTSIFSMSHLIYGPGEKVLPEKAQFVAGEPALALLPVYSYLAGASFRILPNDSLDRVIDYARVTGVRWLIVPQEPKHSSEVRFYAHASWLHEPDRLRSHARLRYCCVVVGRGQGEEQLVFEIVR